MEIEPGTVVLARSASGEMLRRRATTGAMQGGDFPVVWVCSEREWFSARTQGREPDGIPWPADEVQAEARAHAEIA